jgi:hypothetical protein
MVYLAKKCRTLKPLSRHAALDTILIFDCTFTTAYSTRMCLSKCDRYKLEVSTMSVLTRAQSMGGKVTTA